MDKGQAMSITGCLKTWDASMTADGSKSAGATASSSTATPRYVLANVTHDGMGNDAAMAKAEQTFALEAKGTSVNFAPHLNHKVQLTGSLDAKDHGAPQASSTGTAGSTGTATTGRSTGAMQMTMPTFSVSALKMVSASCS